MKRGERYRRHVEAVYVKEAAHLRQRTKDMKAMVEDSQNTRICAGIVPLSSAGIPGLLQSSAKSAPRFVTHVLSSVRSTRTSIADVAPTPVDDVRKNVGKWPLTVGHANSLWEADDKLH